MHSAEAAAGSVFERESAHNGGNALALELGFSSHGHFSDAFRREFGRTPSDVRKADRRALRELSKDLEA